MFPKPPPSPPAQAPAPAWWIQPSVERPRTPLIQGSAIVAALAVAFAGVVSVMAWIAVHPGKGKGQVVAVLPLDFPAPPPPTVEEAPPPPPSPAPRPIVTLPAVHRPDRTEVVVNRIPPVEEAPPLPALPEPEPKCAPPPAAETPPAQPAGETYGTQVLFLNNPAAARELAKHEKKLLFVMHISGNFEDACFT